MKPRLTVAMLNAAIDCAEQHWPGQVDMQLQQFACWIASGLASSERPDEVALAARIESMRSADLKAEDSP